MALVDLWKADRQQISGKRIDQLIAFAGEGKLLDGNITSAELRMLLTIVPSELLGVWIQECLDNRFADFGFVLQDIVNEIGRRLGFQVAHGVYRGHSNEGYDGLWVLSGGAIVVESKSSTAYSINLTRISEYRNQVASQVNLAPEKISILIVVGDEDTSEFEAQVRGSRFAWDIRLLGIKSLFRLLQLKETLDDPAVERQIQGILIPQEFTRLDGIIDLVFVTAEESQSSASVDLGTNQVANDELSREAPSNFQPLMLPRLEQHFGQPLVRRSRIQWATPDDSVLTSCQASKRYENRGMTFWFGLKRTTRESLQEHHNAFCAFGLGSPQDIVLLPYEVLNRYLDTFFSSPDSEGNVLHWHVRFVQSDGRPYLLVDRDKNPVDISAFLLKD